MNGWALAALAGVAALALKGDRMTGDKPRGVRNNNPLNIEAGADWNGLMPVAERDGAQAREDRFAVFQDPAWGFRAGAVILRNYQDWYGLNTVRGIIERWAPSFENHTDAYVSFVARRMGVGPDQSFDVEDPAYLVPLLDAMARMENGGDYYSGEVIREGLRRAGIIQEA